MPSSCACLNVLGDLLAASTGTRRRGSRRSSPGCPPRATAGRYPRRGEIRSIARRRCRPGRARHCAAMRRISFFGTTRVLVSSMAMTSIGRSGPSTLALGGAVGQAEDRGKRVRRHGRAQPLHDVAVVVVMRRLDQDQLKAPCRAAFGVEHPSVPGRRCQAEGSSNGPASLSLPTGRLPAFASSTPENTAGWRETPSAPATTNSKDSNIFPAGGPTE